MYREDGSERRVMLDSEDSIDAVSSDGEAGGVSGAEPGMGEGVVERVLAIELANLKIGAFADGGVGGCKGCSGRGEGGSGGMDKTVAIRLRKDNNYWKLGMRMCSRAGVAARLYLKLLAIIAQDG